MEVDMLLIDGVKYKLWVWSLEEQLTKIVQQLTPEIFGEDTHYFDIKRKLSTTFGEKIPDGYVVAFRKEPTWYIVEVELSSHPLDQHITVQVMGFITAIKNPLNRNRIRDAIWEQLVEDEALKASIIAKVGHIEFFKFVDDLVSKPPALVIIIEQEIEGLSDVVDFLSASLETKVVVLRAFVSDIDTSRQAYLFEPLTVATEGPNYKGFLDELRTELISKRPELKPNKPTDYYCKIPTSHKGVHLEWLVEENEGTTTLGVELHFDRRTHQENLHLSKRLYSKRGEIETSVGAQLLHDPQCQWEKNWSRIYAKREIEQTDEFKDWAVETMIKFYDVFKPILDEIDV
jgi:hypothetical protein